MVEEQFAAIGSSLESWIGTWGEGAEAADVIQSRFNVILSNFSGDIRAFVADAEDSEEQIQRFGVALSADKLIRENPEVFSGRTTGELLTLVAAFQTGAETMEDAFGEFLTLFTRVVGIQQSLKSFAHSDLLTDFSALNLDLTLAETLARVNAELMDAVANFDGSVESFEKIGVLALAAREGELKLLSEIDAIQKGINSNLDKLKADTERHVRRREPGLLRLMKVNRDRQKDLVLVFWIPDLKELNCKSTKATLIGFTLDPDRKKIWGEDDVRIAPNKKCKKPVNKGKHCDGRKAK